MSRQSRLRVPAALAAATAIAIQLLSGTGAEPAAAASPAGAAPRHAATAAPALAKNVARASRRRRCVRRRSGRRVCRPIRRRTAAPAPAPTPAPAPSSRPNLIAWAAAYARQYGNNHPSRSGNFFFYQWRLGACGYTSQTFARCWLYIDGYYLQAYTEWAGMNVTVGYARRYITKTVAVFATLDAAGRVSRQVFDDFGY